jgi:DHA2 family multidrug resistance protein
VHTSRLVSHAAAGNGAYQQMIAGLTQTFVQAGSSTYEAGRRAIATVAQLIARQAGALAYLDTFRFVAIACLAMLPLAWFIKKVPVGKRPVHID